MFSTIAKVFLTKLLTEKFLVAILLHISEYLAKKSDNKLDDKLVEELRKALDAD